MQTGEFFRHLFSGVPGGSAKGARLLLAAACFLCYLNTAWNEYSFDDNIAVTENPYIPKGIRGIPELLTNPYREKSNLVMEYRPLAGITFAVEHQFFKGNPRVSHFVNILLFVLTVWMVFEVMSSVFQLHKAHPALPFWIALMYAVHPAFTEVVASIKNREQILSMLFALLTLLFSSRYFHSNVRQMRYAVLAVFSLALSLLAKMVLTVPVCVTILFLWFYEGRPKRKSVGYFLLLLFAISVLAVSVNIYYSKRTILFLENPMWYLESVSQQLALIFRTLWFYLQFMFWPFPHRYYYGFDMFPVSGGLFTPVAMLSVFVHLSLLLAGIRLFLKRNAIGLFIMCYLANILFYSNIFPVPGIVAERSLFMAGLWLIAAAALCLFYLRKQVMASGMARVGAGAFTILALLLLAVCVRLTILRNFQWKNNLTLLTADMPYLNNSVNANYLYARYLASEATDTLQSLRRKQIALSKKHFRRAMELIPGYFDADFRLGMVYEYEEQNRDSARYFFERAYAANPADNPARFQLAKQYYLHGENQQAEQLFNLVYNELPQDTLTLFFYAQVLFNMGKERQAESVNKELLQLAPETYYPYYNIGMICNFKGETALAVKNLEMALKYGYSDSEVNNILLNYYLSQGETDKAARLEFK